MEDQQSEFVEHLFEVLNCRGKIHLLHFNSLPFFLRYWMLDVSKVYASGSNAWDTAVHNASEEYKQRMVMCVFLHNFVSRNHTPSVHL